MKIKTLIYFIIVFLAILSIIAFVMSFWLGFVSSFRLVFGLLYILFIPGFIWSYVFFKDEKAVDQKQITTTLKEDSKIDVIERIILSVALSLALVPLFIFFINKVGVKINFLSVFLEVLGIILIGVSILFARFFLDKSKKNEN